MIIFKLDYLKIKMEAKGDCVICFESEDLIYDGPSNSDIPTKCMHYFCIYCWEEMYDRNITTCPLCREDVKHWLYSHYPLHENYSDEDSEDEDQNSEDISEDNCPSIREVKS